jgi:hypothetical protein
MNQEEFKKLNQAAQLIKAEQYDKARQLLKTMDNPKAKEWLAKINQKTSQPRQTQQIRSSRIPTPEPEPLLPDTYEFKPRDFTPQPKLKPSRISSGLIMLIVAILLSIGALGVVAKQIMDERQERYDIALSYMPAAKDHLINFCITVFAYVGYSREQCTYYADTVLQNNMYLAPIIVECGRETGGLCGGVPFPEEILGF